MIFNTIEKLRPYFYSLREIDGNVSLDMKLPLKWKYEYKNDNVKIMVQDQNETVNLVSFVTGANSEGYELVFTIAGKIIQSNLELEEKEKLFQQKITELKGLFASESLDTLKDIRFIDESVKPPDEPEITDNQIKLVSDDETSDTEVGQKDKTGS